MNNWKLQIAANVHECEERNKVRRALVERALGSRADGQLMARYIAHRREAESRQSSAAGRCVCLYGRSALPGLCAPLEALASAGRRTHRSDGLRLWRLLVPS